MKPFLTKAGCIAITLLFCFLFLGSSLVSRRGQGTARKEK